MPFDTLQAEQLRVRYLTEAIETATPAGRLVMLYDSLEMDLAKADEAFARGTDLKAVNDCLIHAQDVVRALRETADPSIWDGARRLIALYDYLESELLHANLDKDRARAAAAATHISQLAAAWREAAMRSELSVSA